MGSRKTHEVKILVDEAIVLPDGSELNLTELEALDDVTAGTVAASKAVIVDSNKDISGFRNVSATGTGTFADIASADASLGIAGKAGSAGGAGGAVAEIGGTGHTNGAGGAVSHQGGTGAGTGNGGAASLLGGTSGSGATGNGGAASVNGGLANSTNGNGGAASLVGGEATGTGTGGAVAVTGGASSGATGTAGSVSVDAGAPTGGTAGTVDIGATNANVVNIGKGGGTVNVLSTAALANVAGYDATLDVVGKAGAGGGAGGAVGIAGGTGHTNGAGGAVSQTGGTGAGTGNGGAASVVGGVSGAGATGNGGASSIEGGAAGSTNGDGGAASVTGGAATGTGTGGAASLVGGASAGAGGTAGSVSIDAGAATGGTGGTVSIGGTNATAVSVGRSGQTVNIKGAALTASSAELNVLDGAPANAVFVIGAEAADTINVGIQLRDADNADLAVRGIVKAYLSDDANGDSIVATAPSGGCAIGTDGLLIPATPALTNALMVDGNLAIDAVPEKFKTTQSAAFLINGVSHVKAPETAIVFTAAHVITASKFGIILVQINAAGTVSTKVPGSPQAYDNAGLALAALPAVDAGNVSLGYIAIENNAGDWTANTDDLTNASDVTTAAFTDSTEVAIGAAKAFELVSESDGDIDINIVEAGAKTCYLILAFPNGKIQASDAITFAP